MPGAIRIRWAIRHDYPLIVEMEERCFERPWDEVEIVEEFKQRNAIPMVAEYAFSHHIYGYMLYTLHGDRLHLARIAVLPEYRRQGIGSQMVELLQQKLESQNRPALSAWVDDDNLAAHLFFQSLDFRCNEIRRSHDEYSPDEYLFEHFASLEPAAI